MRVFLGANAETGLGVCALIVLPARVPHLTEDNVPTPFAYFPLDATIGGSSWPLPEYQFTLNGTSWVADPANMFDKVLQCKVRRISLLCCKA